MASSSVCTENVVSKNILSFTHDNFLFTRTVCKVWYKNGKETNTKTSVHRAVDSPSTVDEALEHGYPSDMYNTYLDAFKNGSDLVVFKHLVDTGFTRDEDEVQYASEHGRIDVLKEFKRQGDTMDERVLHNAVRYGHLETLEYLMGVGCSVDSTLIQWGLGDNVVEEVKMRSMEIAVRDGRIDLVKQLRTVDYPFTYETFQVAIEGENMGMLKYLKEEAGEEFKDPYKTHLHRGAIGKDLHMVMLLEKYGCNVRPEVVDAAVYDHDLRLAKYLVRSRGIVPTYRSYGNLLEKHAQDEWFIESLNWLHDEAHCKLELGDGLLVEQLVHQSPMVRQWFSGRE